MDQLVICFPTSIAGTRCYTDALTTPDTAVSVPRQTGLGIFIINTDVQPPLSIFIKATMQDSPLVIMAESAAIALAAQLLNHLQGHQKTLLSDNQQLVNFLNGSNFSDPPDWKIKPYIQITASLLSRTNLVVRTIGRTHNQMADSLVR